MSMLMILDIIKLSCLYSRQVATILQALALHPFEGTDPRLAEYISYFDPVCHNFFKQIWELLQLII